MELAFSAATDVGRQRTHNEDNFLIDKKLRLFLVADGMGGHAAGEVASSIAVHEIRDAIYNKRELIDRYRVDHPGVQAYEILQVLEHAARERRASVRPAAWERPAPGFGGARPFERAVRARREAIGGARSRSKPRPRAPDDRATSGHHSRQSDRRSARRAGASRHG